MALSDGFVDASPVLVSPQAVVLHIVDQLDEEYTHVAIAKLEQNCPWPEHMVDHS